MKLNPLNKYLALGTAQLGLRYGVANSLGQVKEHEAESILTQARAAGICMLDTAIAYGESEKLLGKFGVSSWKVITKLPEVTSGCDDIAGWVAESLEDSLSRLRVKEVYGVLLHSPMQLLGSSGRQVYQALVAFKEQGKAKKIGISIYSPEELDALWPEFQFDLVQAPFNVIDRRLVTSGWLERLNKAHVEVHVRSVFLQGLLLMPVSDLPEYFDQWASLWDAWSKWLNENSLCPLRVCLGFVLSHPEISRIVIGVDNLEQLNEIIGSLSLTDVEPLEDFSCEDLDLISPARWKVK